MSAAPVTQEDVRSSAQDLADLSANTVAVTQLGGSIEDLVGSAKSAQASMSADQSALAPRLARVAGLEKQIASLRGVQ